MATHTRLDNAFNLQAALATGAATAAAVVPHPVSVDDQATDPIDRRRNHGRRPLGLI